MPHSFEGWAKFVLAVFVAGVVINTLAKRIPQVAQIAEGV